MLNTRRQSSVPLMHEKKKRGFKRKKKELLPCKALMAVAAHAGFAKSTKQRMSGSPPRCIMNKLECQYEEPFSNKSKMERENRKRKKKKKELAVIQIPLTCLDSLLTSLTSLYPTKGRKIS